MLKGVILFNTRGDILVDKSGGSGVTKADIEILRGSIIPVKRFSPIFESFGNIYLTHQVNDVYVVGVCNEQAETVFVADLLITLCNYIEDQIKVPLSEAKIKTDFAIIYMIIDQFLIDGYPLASDIHSLTQFISSGQNTKSKARWGFRGKKYIDCQVTETLDVFFDSSGYINLFQIRGVVIVGANLESGLIYLDYKAPPNGFDPIFSSNVNKVLNKANELSLAPPQYPSAIINYTVVASAITPPILLRPRFIWQKDGVRIEIEYRVGQLKPSYCYISFDVPPDMLPPSLAVTEGSVSYHSETRTVSWEVASQVSRAVLTGWIPNDKAQFTEIVTSVKFTSFGPLISGFSVADIKSSVNDETVTKSMKCQIASGRYEFAPLK
ncbi:hypothetical protein TVAG_327520 [Trichomonas vaginalis G3]|uniref:MHD domain-containing protein n=1 Tax=Trichomonas vaginalis (strain ATCC PRA-98 / G3) TaxID=412133 RepID=A2FRM4_TRIV3|nr:anterograde synaptic vesicle transport [Trichomonas vaginalis G3]EAX92443.1 hypothetical protein TVAG_327520 [Trichomonas vaginalis G3]KAI5482950.1 anterograde synaptic vesicle transport [Trichomonas vaginalis G3]|eukprot:XP_001305373.1 hypothetical protein [Trichomonas vaginalis G3]